MEHGLAAGLVIVLLALVVVAVLWLRARRTAAEALAAAGEQGRQAGARVAELQAEVQRLGSRVYLSRFSPDHVYRLLARSEVQARSGQQTLGLVELDSGHRQPFLVDDAMPHLAPGDYFSSAHGQLPKLDGEGFRGAANPKQLASPDTVQPDDRGESAAGGETRPFPAPPGSTADFEDSPAGDETVLYVREDKHSPAQDAEQGLPYLKVTEGKDLDTVFVLNFGVMTIGRDRSNDIVLNDEGSSRVHCEVLFQDHRFLLRDHGSTNGTLCNGEPISERWLEFGDKVRVSDTELVFSCAGHDAGPDDAAAIAALRRCVDAQPDFLDALRLLAFLMERNVAYSKQTGELWRRIAELEQHG